MTTVTIRRTPCHSLTVTGHATGSPAVCAAISGLVFALVGYLMILERAGEVRVCELRLTSGDAQVDASGAAARQPFDMAAVGLMQLAAQYPEYVQIKL